MCNYYIAVVGEDNVLVSDSFVDTVESNVPVSSGNIKLDDSDTEEESRPQGQLRPRPKCKHVVAVGVKSQGTEDDWLAQHTAVQLKNTLR
jgi:hypothetical protein